jgi:hypothetical protein
MFEKKRMNDDLLIMPGFGKNRYISGNFHSTFVQVLYVNVPPLPLSKVPIIMMFKKKD